MDILHLVDRLEELFNQSRPIPLTHNVIVDEDRMLEIIDQMRISIPDEVKNAEQIIAQRDRVLAQAQEEANRTVKLAKEKGDVVYEKVKQAGVPESFLKLLSSDHVDILHNVVHLVGKLQLKEALPSLQRLLQHTDPTVVTEVISALEQLEPTDYMITMLQQAAEQATDIQRQQLFHRAIHHYQHVTS